MYGISVLEVKIYKYLIYIYIGKCLSIISNLKTCGYLKQIFYVVDKWLIHGSKHTRYYNDVTVSAMTSQISSLPIFTQLFIHAQIKENASLAFVGEFTGDR